MTVDIDSRHALEMLGYTARQSRFLVHVALHGGYFLRRQYVAFSGTGHGLAAVRFLAQCVARDHVRALPYGRQGHVFHLFARPLYAAIGEEDNRNRRPAEWDAVMRKLMTLDFVLAHPTARFLATEKEKAALLRERLIPSDVWPHRSYPPRHASGRVTTRYFVDKMPWYQQGDDTRVWIAYVDTERTLQGFQTFLDQYRALLASLPSGVTYVAPTAWHGVIQHAFTKALESRDLRIVGRFMDYCELRRTIDEAHSNWPLTPDQRRRFREQRAEFLTPAFDALYRKFLETSSVSSREVDAAAFPPCLLRVHALDRRYDQARTLKPD
jgi:RimJ/RimL family protein N-acetyltransferase